ncbi:MAG TPA: 16S rRNA (cytidine(1402)-2'-O)-methyltransferase [Pyrinomonadaceae bacterium]|nr:16S rRNA (cytidine(1402)-2'-O)-methyltransferase [Pyrinomonadaceae bacterium]
MPGTLYLVATPIGNLADITLRALDVLRSVDIIACEDTRHTRKLLAHYQISTKLVSYHEHNEDARAEELAGKLAAGASIAVVSDAGTPGICDPGFKVIGRAIDAGANVISIPGACAFVLAAVTSGIGTDAIYFGGFLPARSGERRRRLAEVADIPATLIFYETPHRIAASLKDCAAVLGDRNAAAARELTKLHEETRRGTLTELASFYEKNPAKGEFVVVIERASEKDRSASSEPDQFTARVSEFENEGLDRRAAMRKAAKEFGLARAEAYRLLQSQKDG